MTTPSVERAAQRLFGLAVEDFSLVGDERSNLLFHQTENYGDWLALEQRNVVLAPKEW